MQYLPGDLVFVHQGKGNLFELKAKVIKSLHMNVYKNFNDSLAQNKNTQVVNSSHFWLRPNRPDIQI